MAELDRKAIETQTYDELYAARKVNADPTLRELLLSEAEIAFQRRVVELCRGKRVLEIGFGDGAPSIWAAQAGAAVSAVDISSQAVAFAREQAALKGIGAKIEFSVMDVEKLEFSDSTFDVIIDNEVFSSLDLKKALPEMRRVMKPGAVLIGKETFGHNPIFNLKRYLNVIRGKRTEWAAAHVMREEDFSFAATLFQIENRRHLHLSVLGLAPLYFLGLRSALQPTVSVFQSIDRGLLCLPFLRNQAFKVLFELRKPS